MVENALCFNQMHKTKNVHFHTGMAFPYDMQLYQHWKYKEACPETYEKTAFSRCIKKINSSAFSLNIVITLLPSANEQMLNMLQSREREKTKKKRKLLRVHFPIQFVKIIAYHLKIINNEILRWHSHFRRNLITTQNFSVQGYI